MSHGGFRALALGDVARDALDSHQVVTFEHGGEPLLDPGDAAVLAMDADVAWLGQTGVVAEVRGFGQVLLTHDGDDQAGIAVEVLRRVAEDRERRRADVVEPGVGLHPVAEDEVLGVLGQQAEGVSAAPVRARCACAAH